jgi:Right handed beta helix region
MENPTLNFLRLLGLLLTCSPALAQTTWYVDVNGTAPGSGSQNDPYTSIQYAIDQGATVDGDTLLVRPGVYLETVDYRSKALAVRSTGGPDVTTIQIPVGYPSRGVTVTGGQGAGTSLEGFTITGDGDASEPGIGVRVVGSTLVLLDCKIIDAGTGGSLRSVGLYGENATLQVVDCQVRSHESDNYYQGAGVGLVQSTAKFLRCDISDNFGMEGAGAWVQGGAVEFEDCTFVGNRSPNDPGGGLYVEGGASVSLLLCTFKANDTTEGYPGGGVCSWGSTLLVDDCLFEDNEASKGGAIFLLGGTATVSNSHFVGNIASENTGYGIGDGGAVYGLMDLTIERCVFDSNEAQGNEYGDGFGGAVFTSGTIRSCSFSGNLAQTAGGSIWSSGTAANSILWGGSPDEVAGTLSITWSDIQGGYPGQGNIDADPLLSVDWIPLPHSPCIDAGDPDSSVDPDGTRADMGAHPYTWTAMGGSYCPATVNSTGLPASLSVLGSPVPTDNWVRLLAVDASPNQYGYYLMSVTQDFVPLFAGSQGNLCLGAPIIRFNNTNDGGAVLYSGPEGVFNFMPDLTNLPQGVVFQAGQTWNFQLWFRDIVNGNFTSNTSDGVAVGWL